MAQRLASKIHRALIQTYQNLRLYSKPAFNIKAPPNLENDKLLSGILDGGSREEIENAAPYHVCKRKIVDFSSELRQEFEYQKRNMETKHLQPCMLPEYCKPVLDLTSVCPEASQRCNNETTFCSRTRWGKATAKQPEAQPCSREKIEQIVAESKNAKKFSPSLKLQHRFYCTVGPDPEKCKKLKSGKKTCPKMVAPGCIPPKSIKCGTRVKYKDCVKQEAPYPSYSESCHEDLEMKPSECRLCPWKPEDNPNFKMPKKKYHTSSAHFRPHGDDGMYAKRTIDFPESFEEPIKESARNSLDLDEAAAGRRSSSVGMLCDLKKGPCKKPPPKPCQTTKKEKKKPPPPPKKKDPCEKYNRWSPADVLNDIILDKPNGHVRDERDGGSLAVLMKNNSDPSTVGPCGGKCKKLPHDNCVEKKRKTRKVDDRCPKKKKKKMRDCPGEGQKCWDTKCDGLTSSSSLSASPMLGLPIEEQIGMIAKDDEKKKCPKIDLGVCKDDDKDDDPCGRKRKGISRECPSDLLERYKNKKGKPKPKKRAEEGFVPPLADLHELPRVEM